MTNKRTFGFTAEEIKQMEADARNLQHAEVKQGPRVKLFIMGDSEENGHGHFFSPYGRGFTAEEREQVAAGTYINPKVK